MIIIELKGEIIVALSKHFRLKGRPAPSLIALGAQRWGNFNTANDEVRLLEAGATGAIDLSDFAAAQTLLNSGAVYALQPEEMPHNSTVATVFRYGRASRVRAA